MKQKLRHIASNPATQKALTSLKPEKTLWGILGVIVFIIAPEIVAFGWGSEITAYAKTIVAHPPSLIEKSYGDLLMMLFEDGGSWFNLAFGIALLVWLFF